MTSLRIGATSLVGQVRSANEDSYLVTDELVAVADGMGGHRAGEVASADTVEVLRSATGSRSIEDLVAAVHRANRRINERAAEDDDLRGMGTTVCVVGLVRYDGEDELAVLNVGDSRVYLFAEGELTRLTEDHSLVETLVREGRISAEEAEHHPQRNVITRALGVEALVVVDAWLLHPCDGDRLLLCSDGLFGEIGEEHIAEILAEDEEPAVVARRLAAEADAAGGRDNITAVVLDVSDVGAGAVPVKRRYRRISTPAVDMSDPDEDGPRTQTVMAVVVPAHDPDTVIDEDVADAADDDASTVVPEADGDDDAEVDGADRSAADRGDEGVHAGRDGTQGDAEADADADGEVDAATVGRHRGGDGDGDHDGGDDDEDVHDTDDTDDPAADGEAAPPGRSWRTALFVLAVAALIAVMAGVLVIWSRSGWVVTERNHAVVLIRGPKDGVLFLGPTQVHRYDDVDVGALSPAVRRDLSRGHPVTGRSAADVFVRGLRRQAEEPSTSSTTLPTSTLPPTTLPPTTAVAPTSPPTVGSSVTPGPAGP